MTSKEIELLREEAMEEFEKTPKGILLSLQRIIAEEALKLKLAEEDHTLLENYIDNITEFFFEQAVYIFHKAYRNK